jgi:hypothetical protein
MAIATRPNKPDPIPHVRVAEKTMKRWGNTAAAMIIVLTIFSIIVAIVCIATLSPLSSTSKSLSIGVASGLIVFAAVSFVIGIIAITHIKGAHKQFESNVRMIPKCDPASAAAPQTNGVQRMLGVLNKSARGGLPVFPTPPELTPAHIVPSPAASPIPPPSGGTTLKDIHAQLLLPSPQPLPPLPVGASSNKGSGKP